MKMPHGLTGLVLHLEHVGLAFGRFGHRHVRRLQRGAAEERQQIAIELGAQAAQARLFELLGIELLSRRALAHHNLHAAAHAAAVLHVFPRRVAGQHRRALDRHAAHHLGVFAAVHVIGQLQRQRRSCPAPAAAPSRARTVPRG